MPKTVETLAKAIEPVAVDGPTDAVVSAVTCDSRQVRAGALFVAIPGLHVDGWTCADEAIQRGAVGVVTEHHEPLQGGGACVLHVRDARRAAGLAAAAFHDHPSDHLDTIGITGTNGKTTVAYMIRAILDAAERTCGMLTTVMYQIGARTIPALRTTPEAPELHRMLSQMHAAGCRAAVMEVSSHALEQQRTAGVDFDVGVFTNLTRDHLDYHGSMESYFDAKKKLFAALGRGRKTATAVIGTDNTWGRRLAAIPWSDARVLTTGLEGSPDLGIEALVLTAKGSRFDVRTPWGGAEVRLPLMGRFNVRNALCAIAACGAIGVDVELAARALGGVARVPGRLERVPVNAPFAIYVDYAHTDDALERVLETLREITTGRLVVVFGCGGDRDPSKRPAMGRAAAHGADRTVLTSDNPRREDPAAIIEAIRAGFKDAPAPAVVVDRRAAIRHALDLAAPGDAVLIAGKGHETFQEFANTTVPFDDRQVVFDVAAERGW
jgi:UDP-N-acetylmuramoyl-L-alanyl-D-glutamate--2,6-diaminopimelate ligase